MMGADERAQHVWAHDGNVQSYHWRFMTSVGRKNVAGFFPASFTDAGNLHSVINDFLLVFSSVFLYLQATDFRTI